MSARSTALTRSAHNRPMNSRRFMQPDPIDNRKNWDIGGGDVHSTPEANMSTQKNGSGTDPSKSKLGHNPSIFFCGRHPPKQTVRLSRPPCATQPCTDATSGRHRMSDQQPTFKPVPFRKSRKPHTARHHHAVWGSRMRVCRLGQPSMGHMEVGAPRLYGEANSLTNRVAWPFHFSYYLRFTPESGHLHRNARCPLWAISGRTVLAFSTKFRI